MSRSAFLSLTLLLSGLSVEGTATQRSLWHGGRGLAARGAGEDDAATDAEFVAAANDVDAVSAEKKQDDAENDEDVKEEDKDDDDYDGESEDDDDADNAPAAKAKVVAQAAVDNSVVAQAEAVQSDLTQSLRGLWVTSNDDSDDDSDDEPAPVTKGQTVLTQMDVDSDDHDEAPAIGPKRAPGASVTTVKSLVAAKRVTASGLAKEEDELETQMSPHAKEESRLKKGVKMADEDLAANLHEQAELRQRIANLSDQIHSDEEIDDQAEQVATETDLTAMGGMLGSMWEDMRMFAVPSYAKHIEEELHDLEHDQQKLEAKVKAANLKLSYVHEKWSHKDAGGKSIKLPAHKGGDIEFHASKTEAGPTWNFWKMHRVGKISFVAGSLVYIVAGICLAFIYNSARVQNPMFTADESIVQPRQTQFSVSLFGCFGAPHIAVMGCCFPCLQWADTMDRGTVDQKPLLRYWKAFAAFFTLMVLHCYTWGISSLALIGMGVWFRQKLRETYSIESGTPGTLTVDILAWVCCQPCAIIQEARERSIPRCEV